MMPVASTSNQPNCYLARDLFITYLAGEASPETQLWLERHMEECSECRAALARLRGASAQAIATGQTATGEQLGIDEPWLRLITRIRRRNRTVIVVLSLALLVTICTVRSAVSSLSSWGELPLVQPVPAASVSPEEAIDVDLSGFGLKPGGVTTKGNGAIAHWIDPEGRVVTVEASRSDTIAQAHEAFRVWMGQYPIRLAAMSSYDEGRHAMAMFCNFSQYAYAWQTDVWLVAIRVPSRVSRPARLCSSIRDLLYQAYSGTDTAKPGAPTPK